MADLLSVLVGGVLAVGGGAATQWYLYYIKTLEERRTRRAAKFEELMTAVYEHEHWLTNQRNIRVFGAQLEEKTDPFAKIQAIAALYFPTFLGRITELRDGANKYESWMLDRGLARLRGETSELTKGSKEAYADYSRVRVTLLNELQELARQDFAQQTPAASALRPRLLRLLTGRR
jgi:hypothetical protein